MVQATLLSLSNQLAIHVKPALRGGSRPYAFAPTPHMGRTPETEKAPDALGAAGVQLNVRQRTD